MRWVERGPPTTSDALCSPAHAPFRAAGFRSLWDIRDHTSRRLAAAEHTATLSSTAAAADGSICDCRPSTCTAGVSAGNRVDFPHAETGGRCTTWPTLPNIVRPVEGSGPGVAELAECTGHF